MNVARLPKQSKSGIATMPSVLNRLSEGAAILDAKTQQILFANDALVSMLGFSREELEALPQFLALAEPGASVIALEDAHDDHGQLVGRFELPVRHKDGRSIQVDVGMSVLVDTHVAIVRDVSSRTRAAEALLRVHDALEIGIREQSLELARMNKALKEAIAVRDDFLTIASHELRTPLTPLLLQLQSLSRAIDHEGVDAPTLRASFAGMERNVTRLTRLVDQLLDISRIANGGLQLEREPTDLAEIVRTAVARASSEITRRGYTLSIAMSESAIVGDWDPLRVDQIFTNLLSNAIKYGDGKPIDVTLETSDAHVRMVVRDRGIGMSEKDIARVFERFERAVSARHYGGFGLGLWIARQAAEAHGGTIHATSNAVDGTTFVVELPRAR